MDRVSKQFSKVYDEYIDKIYRFVYLKVNSQETAEDITSRVFTKGWEAFLASGGRVNNPGAFLYQIARNTVIDHYRSKGRTNIVSTEVVPEMTDPSHNIHEKAVLSSEVETVRKSIGKLDKDYQDIILLHYLEDMPVSDIAELMGKSEGNVRVMLHRGLKELKSVINRQVQTS